MKPRYNQQLGQHNHPQSWVQCNSPKQGFGSKHVISSTLSPWHTVWLGGPKNKFCILCWCTIMPHMAAAKRNSFNEHQTSPEICFSVTNVKLPNKVDGGKASYKSCLGTRQDFILFLVLFFFFFPPSRKYFAAAEKKLPLKLKSNAWLIFHQKTFSNLVIFFELVYSFPHSRRPFKQLVTIELACNHS